jgi:cytochrome d ubiquinol oxidase subunit II
MPAVWYFVLAAMLTAYAVLDGFDFGVGIVHLLVARSDAARRHALAAIGPLWDGNEVWLIAAGGSFFFAFPRAYAAAFSGLYLPLMVVLWLLILRGVAIELRSSVQHPLWRTAWDTVFAGASTTMAFVLGVAIGNVLRGVPLDATGYFREDLFRGMGSAAVGAVDGFTAVTGLLAIAVLGAHGASFLAWKTTGDLAARARIAGRRLWPAAIALGALATLLLALRSPAFFGSVAARPWIWPLPAGAIGAAVTGWRALGAGRDRAAFLASSAFIVAMLLASAGALYPAILPSTIDPAFTLDARSAATASGTLAVGLAILGPALVLAGVYFVILFRAFRGKADAAAYDHE